MKRRIALFSAFYPYRGGIAQFSANLYRALEQEGQDPVAFTFKRQYPDFLFPGKTQKVESGDNADPIPAKRVLDSANPLTYRFAAKEIAATHPDLIISQYWMTYFAPSTGALHKYLGKRNIKRISILHNVVPHEKRFYDERANRYFLKQNEGFVVMSDAVLTDLLLFQPNAKYLRIDHPAYSHFGEGISRDNALEILKLDKNKKYILFFGFIRKYKGLDVLIDALKDLSQEYHLIVAGEAYGSMKEYEDQIELAGLKDRIHLYNEYIGDDQVKIYFSASDVCVLPYRSATQSGITAIANHFCLPVIATDVGGLKEVITSGTDGLIVEHADPHLIGNAIKRYFQDGLKEQFVSKLTSDRENKSWDNFARSLLDFADSL